MSIYEVIKRPIVTEKSNLIKEGSNSYVFEVDRNADKPLIRKAVEELFKVKVEHVTTLIQRGKYKKFARESGRTKAWKKAVVSLAENDKIELFDGV